MKGWPPACRGKQLNRTLNNIKTTVLCGLVTVLVLRGTIGMGGLRLPKGGGRGGSEETPTLAKHSRLLQDSTPTVEEKEKPSTFAGFSPVITDWDARLAAWRTRNPQSPLQILLVSGSSPSPCSNPGGDHYLLKSVKNKMDYARLHGLQMFYSMSDFDEQLVGFWSKLPLLRKLMLGHPEVEWLWWMDCDAMFTDMEFELPVQKYGNHNLVLHGWEDDVYEKRSWVGLNTGSFVIRNCQWSLDLLDAWAPMGAKGRVRHEMGVVLTEALDGRPDFDADDQSALIYLLSMQREVWGDKVFLENAYYLHGYWLKFVDKYEELMAVSHNGYGDDRWPFVTHFVGCKPCGTQGDYSKERCLKQMERAFNFGDNQVLLNYGFAHKTLGAHNIETARNDSREASSSEKPSN